MKTHWKIPNVCLQLLLMLGLLLGTQGTVKADQYEEGLAAYEAGNYQKALEIFKPLADQGLSEAQYKLGIMYNYGWGVPQDFKGEIKWYRKAAEQGDTDGQLSLSRMYYQGKGVPQDYTEAVKWLSKAAEQGIADAQYFLGAMYLLGQGVPQDYVQAHQWSNLSASRSQRNPHKTATDQRDLLEKIMTPAQVTEAQKLAREWKPKTWKELSQQNGN